MTKPTFILKVAIPSPLRDYFDYLPVKHTPHDQQRPGMRVMVPFGRRLVVGVITAIASDTQVPQQKLRAAQRLLDTKPTLSSNMLSLCQWAVRYYHHSPGDVFQHALPLALRSDKVPLEATERFWKASKKGQLIILSKLNRSPKQQETLQRLREHPSGLSQDFLAGIEIKRSTLKALESKGLCEQFEQNSDTSSDRWNTKPITKEPHLPLNTQQSAAVEQVLAASTNTFTTFLLNGVTGSGKTEVYLQIIAAVLAQHKQALILVPEIGLTPQTVKRFEQRFTVPIFTIHSNLTANQRLNTWRRANSGDAAVIIGTRSALFTPLKYPGIIIVDEEHDASYKQQEGFRYSARDLAIVRANIEKTPIILGSATPSLESLHNAKEGRYQHLHLTERAGQASLPQFHLTDIRQSELRQGLCKTLISAIRTELNKGNQVLYFLNRRGYSPLLMCHDCGWNASCRQCDARMTYHQHPRHLHCHHCDYQTAILHHCPDCQSTDLRPIGQGTERVDENLASLFPEETIIRIDRDTTRRKQALEQQLNQINTGKPCILIGTQMLAKGHHFPHVTLVVIADIDSGLFAADFRATEHTAQLVLQVAGRAGRAEKPGKVVLQSHNPDHHVLQSLIKQDYSTFCTQTLPERKLTGLPPYGYLAIFRAESTNNSDVIGFLEALLASFQTHGDKVDAWGPIPAILARKGGYYRHHVLLRASERTALHQALSHILATSSQNPFARKVRWHLDVDPIQVS